MPPSNGFYGYVHGDPVNNVDPSGEFIAGLAGLLVGFTVSRTLSSRDAGAKISVGTRVIRGLLIGGSGVGTYFGVGLVNVGLYQYDPEWKATGMRPKHDENSLKSLWIENVAKVLQNHVNNQTNLTAAQRNAALSGAHDIAVKYVELVQDRGTRFHGLQDANAAQFGRGGSYGWKQNYGREECKCKTWVNALAPRLDHVATGSGWVIRGHQNRITAGDVSLFWWTHSYMTITLEPGSGPEAPLRPVDKPDFVLDAWATGRPDIFEAESFLKRWPFETWPFGGLNPWED